MNGGVKAALLVSCLGIAGCTTAVKEVKVQAIPDPAAAFSRGGDVTAVARGEFMIGNVGLALEGFRKAQRANPGDPAAVAGIGDCYAAMGRLDLAQSSYEAALALAPHNRQLLLALATIFDREGQVLKAMAARADADRAVQPAAAATAIAAAPKLPGPARAPAATTAAAPRPLPPPTAMVVAAAPDLKAMSAATPVTAGPPVRIAAPATDGIAMSAVTPSAAAAPVRIVPPAPAAAIVTSTSRPVAEEAQLPMHASTGSITVELPPARPATRIEAKLSAPPLQPIEEPVVLSSSVTVALPPARPAPAKRPARSEDPPIAVAEASGPRLERLSRGEVALVTTDKPIWNTQRETGMASVLGVRWAALRPSLDSRPNIQVLNAARTRGIAGSARTVLLNRGWRRIDVGDSPATRETSVVLYSRNREKLGKSLAAQFGVAARMVERDVLVLVIGRDAVDRVTGQRKS